MNIQEGQELITHVKGYLDRYVMGHEDIKEGLLLSLVAREHLYIEGPPGTAKTMLAEITAKAASLEYFFYQFHRDTRLTELLGDYHLQRENRDGVEYIRSGIERGGILTTDICLLDDISRAPGEALNVLLRILNERKFGQEKIPLLTAIATSNPTDDNYYNEPLDRANLDRFTLQIKASGLIQGGHWHTAEQVIDHYSHYNFDLDEVESRPGIHLKGRADPLVHLVLSELTKRGLLLFLAKLTGEYKLQEENSLLTDRTFLVKACRVLKAKSYLECREETCLKDLFALRYLTAFRVPPEVHERIEEIIKEVIFQVEEDWKKPTSGGHSGSPPIEEEEGKSHPLPPAKEPKERTGLLEDLGDSNDDWKQRGKKKGLYQVDERQDYNEQMLANLEPLLRTLEGRIVRNVAQEEDFPGGQPRFYRQFAYPEDFWESHPIDGMLWLEDALPGLPRVFRRTRKEKGGEIAILRDVSLSMAGRSSRWVSMVIMGLLEIARKAKMGVGYVEFNHESHKYLSQGKFFSQDHSRLFDRAKDCRCVGLTNYQAPLREAIEEFSRRGSHRRHVVFLTDGLPTEGDPEVRQELSLAQKGKIFIHSVFIGRSNPPKILRTVSQVTGGIHFQVAPNRNGVLRITQMIS